MTQPPHQPLTHSTHSCRQISDRGGGVPRSVSDMLFHYMYSTAPKPSVAGDAAPLAGRRAPINSPVHFGPGDLESEFVLDGRTPRLPPYAILLDTGCKLFYVYFGVKSNLCLKLFLCHLIL